MSKMTHVMLDLETMSTRADGIIVSIGACKFNLATAEIDDNGFYASVSMQSNLELVRHLSEDTFLWWLRQSAAAQAVFHEPKLTLPAALRELSDWFETDTFEVVSNGADFDLPMLAHAFDQCGIEIPWRFWNSRCFRTYKTLPGAKQVPAPQVGVKHNALSDAVSQAQHMCAIQRALFPSACTVPPAVKARPKPTKAAAARK